jgi:hypothetical protein
MEQVIFHFVCLKSRLLLKKKSLPVQAKAFNDELALKLFPELLSV